MPSTRCHELETCAAENVKRRLRERKRSGLIQSFIYFGDNVLEEFRYERGLGGSMTPEQRTFIPALSR
ncbi:uncharacterized protein K444DRAFT_621171 [Hyaloscypha bicolor E]|uniref:Uncharacterized protein n=1 Tax=Hyaloscypha bicolor E TaxID=1095630 RepID=A0A2J6SMQ5_9HELO|nr:uncharacterized protein K444DRAFT_621171 [Hyaloscypha bicolor E]PMD52047.1 hypothetical protein K444DRAFT_621171 [Hyaloscypha bicolor E]